jgi:2-oxoacid:acceptor oxidoreductase gamma subunit (pyruvate/2-ketoisovalerate family)
MYEIRLHGLGGDGVVRLSEIIGMAVMESGKWAHSFPFFGTEIRGAAVKAFTRIDDKPITIRSYIYEPDVLILTNDVLLDQPDVTAGIQKKTIFIVNTKLDKKALEERFGCTVHTIDAVDLAYNIIGKPIVNTIMLGAFIAATGIMTLDAAEKINRHSFSESIAEKNNLAMRAGHDYILEGKK